MNKNFSCSDTVKLYAFSAFIVVFMLLTQQFVGPERAAVGFSDTRSYMAIAECIQNDNCAFLNRQYASHHLERWLPNLGIGLIASFSGLDVWKIYQLVIFLLLLSTVLIVSKLPLSLSNKVALVSMTMLVPYSFRSYLFAPAMLTDALFYVCMLLVVLALLKRHLFLLMMTILLACFSRQTTLLLLPILAVASFHRLLTIRQFWLAALLILVGLWLNQQVSANFFGASSTFTVSRLFGFLHWAAAGGNLKEFVGFAGRFGLFLMLFTPLLVLNINRQYGILVIACFLAIAAQPLLAGPGITGNSIQRLLTYFVPFVGFLFVGQVQKPAAVALFASAMMLLSLHHNYTVIGSQWVFGVIVLLVAAASVTYFFWQNYCSRRARSSV